MNKITFFHGAETSRLKKVNHKTRDKDLCSRANAVLLVLKSASKSEVACILQAGCSSVNRWLTWYEVAGVDGLKTTGVGRPVRQPKAFICKMLRLLLEQTPRTLCYQRSRLSTELFALQLRKLCSIKMYSFTIRRWLPKLGMVWCRTAPTLYIRDPDKDAKLAAMLEALDKSSIDHPVFYEDEVDIHLNPKIGAEWASKVSSVKSRHQGKTINTIWPERYTARVYKSAM